MVAVTICSDFGAQENKICECPNICWMNTQMNDLTWWLHTTSGSQMNSNLKDSICLSLCQESEGHKRRLSAKELMLLNVVLDKTFESPLGCKEIKSINPKEINLEYSWEGLMLKLKLQYFGHLM